MKNSPPPRAPRFPRRAGAAPAGAYADAVILRDDALVSATGPSATSVLTGAGPTQARGATTVSSHGVAAPAADPVPASASARYSSFRAILRAAADLPDRRIAVASAESPEVLEAVERARAEGIATATLVGDVPAIRALLAGLGIDPAPYDFEQAAEPADAAARAVRLVATGEADICLKGLLDTSVLLRAVLDREHGLREPGPGVLSHVALFEAPHYPRLFAVTDAAMNIAPDVPTLAALVRNAVRVTRALGIDPAKVAALAAKEKVSPKMPATVAAAQLASMSFDGAIVAGPLALDGAISPDAAAVKGIAGPIQGDADVLLAPWIEAGNALYKALTLLCGARAAGIVVGARRPVVLTSRADDDDTVLSSIALAMLVAEAAR